MAVRSPKPPKLQKSNLSEKLTAVPIQCAAIMPHPLSARKPFLIFLRVFRRPDLSLRVSLGQVPGRINCESTTPRNLDTRPTLRYCPAEHVTAVEPQMPKARLTSVVVFTSRITTPPGASHLFLLSRNSRSRGGPSCLLSSRVGRA